ncbi:MAG TPA: nucleotidyl transferase AbiEii/AbiGii toxin family protein [Nitrospirota bacterium]|nr:nucleotidyl transferase AbiEii/AbiGii toxin family protein [Nitrospirota bacterium]
MYLKCLSPSARNVLKVIAPVVDEKGFVLAGGTAIALFLGHRLSVDFDFFTTRNFRPDRLHLAISGLGLETMVLQEEPGTLTLSADGVKVSFFHYPYAFLDVTSKLYGVKVAGLVDIASMKLMAMMQRGAKRDYVDLYWILQNMPFSKIAENMVKRYGSNRVNPLVIGKALVFFRDADADPDPEFLGKRVAWAKIKKYLVDHVQQFVLDIQTVIKND